MELMTLPYEDALENAFYERSVDLVRSAKGYTVRAVVPNGGARTVNLRIPAGGAFMVHGVMGRAMGPVNAGGIRISGATSFPMAGSSSVANAPMADRGLVMTIRLMDGRSLTNEKRHFTTLYNDVAVGSFLSAGYGTAWSYSVQPFRLFLAEGSMLSFDIRNLDAPGEDLYHRLDLILLGERHAR